MHFSDAFICLISSALVGGNVRKLGKDSIRKSLKVAGGGSIMEVIFLPILEKIYPPILEKNVYFSKIGKNMKG